MKFTLLCSTILLFSLSTSSLAAKNNWQKEALDAWIDGKAETTLLFNSNLNSFDINTDVSMGTVMLTGTVNNEVEKELAEELISGIDGVTAVNNQLILSPSSKESQPEDMLKFTDTKITSVISSRLLLNSEVSGLKISVDVDDRIVTLSGIVETEAERDLAINIAKNTVDVKSVTSNITIEPNA